MTYFEFYGIKPGLIIDLKDLKNKFLQVSRMYHPDHFALDNVVQQNEADEKSALNNQAYRTLLDPDLRIKYVLQLKDQIKEEEVFTLDPEFLMEMMDINDLIEENPTLAKSTLSEMEERLNQDIEPELAAFDFLSPSEHSLHRIKEYYSKRRYILRLMDNLNKFAPGQTL